jgi:hypothetical protein
MSVSPLKHITRNGVEQLGDLADSLKDPEVLRLENLDTDLRPTSRAIEITKRAVVDDDANSYLPFFGLDVLRQAAAGLVGKQAVHSPNGIRFAQANRRSRGNLRSSFSQQADD